MEKKSARWGQVISAAQAAPEGKGSAVPGLGCTGLWRPDRRDTGGQMFPVFDNQLCYFRQTDETRSANKYFQLLENQLFLVIQG